MLAIAGAGCLGSSPVSRYYTLSTLSPQDGRGGGGVDPAMRIRVAPVTLPEGVDRPQLVRRTGENTVVVEEYDRWVEPLDALLRKGQTRNANICGAPRFQATAEKDSPANTQTGR